jgi:predicted component of type VI protein secretion system
MRRVYTHREEAAAKGAAARARMLERYSPDAIADVLVKHLKRIEAVVP